MAMGWRLNLLCGRARRRGQQPLMDFAVEDAQLQEAAIGFECFVAAVVGAGEAFVVLPATQWTGDQPTPSWL